MPSYWRSNEIPRVTKCITIVDPVNNTLIHALDYHIKRTDSLDALYRYLNYALRICIQRQSYNYLLAQKRYVDKFGNCHRNANVWNHFDMIK